MEQNPKSNHAQGLVGYDLNWPRQKEQAHHRLDVGRERGHKEAVQPGGFLFVRDRFAESNVKGAEWVESGKKSKREIECF